jgi:hypothetical protein
LCMYIYCIIFLCPMLSFNFSLDAMFNSVPIYLIEGYEIHRKHAKITH